ncbi:MAG: hypothetical protein IJB85_00800 [Clostridia bacterium]|nr:hypothetical protein [Clostridia bacterium]
MMLEMILCLMASVAIAAYGINRRRKEVFREDRHQDELLCIVTFHDRRVTLPLIEGYFEEAQIRILDLERSIKRTNGVDLFTNTYKLYLPPHVAQAEIVSRISGFATVQRVQIKPL